MLLLSHALDIVGKEYVLFIVPSSHILSSSLDQIENSVCNIFYSILKNIC